MRTLYFSLLFKRDSFMNAINYSKIFMSPQTPFSFQTAPILRNRSLMYFLLTKFNITKLEFIDDVYSEVSMVSILPLIYVYVQCKYRSIVKYCFNFVCWFQIAVFYVWSQLPHIYWYMLYIKTVLLLHQIHCLATNNVNMWKVT